MGLKFDEHGYAIFSSGKRCYCNMETFGIDSEGNACYGSDGGYGPRDFTPEERRELAEYNIALWKKFGGL